MITFIHEGQRRERKPGALYRQGNKHLFIIFRKGGQRSSMRRVGDLLGNM